MLLTSGEYTITLTRGIVAAFPIYDEFWSKGEIVGQRVLFKRTEVGDPYNWQDAPEIPRCLI